MRRAYYEWIALIDPALRTAMSRSLAPWLGTAAASLLLIVACGVLPATSGYFALDVQLALAVWAATFGFGIGVTWLDRHAQFSPPVYGLVFLMGCSLMLLFTACLASLSEPPGASVLAGGFVLSSGYYGHMHRSTLRYPFGLCAVVFALVVAVLLDRDGSSYSLLAVTGTLAVGANWLLGSIAYRAQKARVRSESLRAAVQAQILDERSRDVSRLSGAMLHVLQTTHDAANALSSALLNAETLRKSTEARSRGEEVDVDEHGAACDLTDQLVRLRRLVEETRDVGHRGDRSAEPPTEVAPLPVVSNVLRELRNRFSTVEFRSTGASPAVRVLVSGGAPTLHRILENLVLNACQGDGDRGARAVEVRIDYASTVGSVALRVLDDGPGFTREQLAEPITGFQSGKPDGTGLGLYTAERLARASGGSLSRENRPSGGALVTVYLVGRPVS